MHFVAVLVVMSYTCWNACRCVIYFVAVLAVISYALLKGKWSNQLLVIMCSFETPFLSFREDNKLQVLENQ